MFAGHTDHAGITSNHIATVRDTLTHHQDFLKSQDYNFFLALVEVITNKVQSPVIRHAQMKDWTTDSQALARGAPFTGTAIYLRTTPAWHEGAWPLWTHVVRNIDGCLGCSGGPLLEIVQTVPGSMEKTVKRDTQPHSFENSYIVYVGWQTTEQHHAYHRTQHFAEHSVILRSGNEGYAEYGHIVFKGGREKEPVPKL